MSDNGNTAMFIPDKADAEKISKVISEISDQMTKIEATKDYIKEAKKALKEDWDLPPKVINLMIKLYHNRSAGAYFEEQDETKMLYDALFGIGE